MTGRPGHSLPGSFIRRHLPCPHSLRFKKTLLNFIFLR
ncbi:hypothetical protein B4135_0182 [Caldibacillus debilis]|uniref:Uncharacterized protein n=1 Tax=Caldibacillus debilis TaxID=301148 RepID=A0A150LVZ6_9BACI|nr:hypothetical protein B4135_0182 [Caldibacillus debilis]